MSDGPHRTLNMNAAWKRVAEYADNSAYSIREVAEAYLPALERNCREEVPEEVWRSLSKIFREYQQALFADQKIREVAALRFRVAGMPLGCALVDRAIQVASSGSLGEDVLVSILKEALLNRGVRGNRQVEEHYYRKSTDEQRTSNVRDRLEAALKSAAVENLARRVLNMPAASAAARPKKKAEIDDGVEL